MEPKEISRTSFLYKWCFGYRKHSVYEATTCSLVWFSLLAVVAWPARIIFELIFLVGFVVGLSAISIVAMLFACRPYYVFEDCGFGLAPYKHWPRWRGRRIFPILILLPAFFLYRLWVLLSSLNFKDVFQSDIFPSFMIVIGTVAIFAAFLVIWIFLKKSFKSIRESESWINFKQGYRDWKDGVCRKVVFVHMDRKLVKEIKEAREKDENQS